MLYLSITLPCNVRVCVSQKWLKGLGIIVYTITKIYIKIYVHFVVPSTLLFFTHSLSLSVSIIFGMSQWRAGARYIFNVFNSWLMRQNQFISSIVKQDLRTSIEVTIVLSLHPSFSAASWIQLGMRDPKKRNRVASSLLLLYFAFVIQKNNKSLVAGGCVRCFLSPTR